MVNPNCPRCKGTGLVTISYGGDGYGGRCAAMADADDQPCPECEEWDADEELGSEDLEERLDRALDRVFDADVERSDRQGDLIAMFRAEY